MNSQASRHYPLHTFIQKKNESTNDFEYRQTIGFALNLINSYLSERKANATCSHIANEMFRIEYFTTFKMPTDDGGYYWETETSSIINHSWYNHYDALKWLVE